MCYSQGNYRKNKAAYYRAIPVCYISYYVKTGRVKEGISYFEKNEKALFHFLKYEPFLNQLSTYVLSAYLLLIAREFKRGMACLGRVINNKDAQWKPSSDFEFVPLFLNLLFHFELGHNDLIPYLATSIYRTIGKKEKVLNAEKIFLSFMKKIPPKNNSESLTHAFTELKKQLHPLMNVPEEKPFFETIDYMAWIESKLTGKPMSEVIYDKNDRSR